MTTLADLPPLDEAHMSRGGNPDLLADELRWHIVRAIREHPRSQQRRIGPSEIGTPCMRRLGHKLADTAPVNDDPARRWRPTVGTATHAWLAEAFTTANRELGYTRYLVKSTVTVGRLGGEEITGSADLYDRATATVIDWKIVGSTTLRAVRVRGVSAQYHTQVQLYGRGLAARGVPVDTVAVCYLPVSGDLNSLVYRPAPYNPQVAERALSLAEGLILAITTAGAKAVLPQLNTEDDYCTGCPFFLPDASDLTRACPGSETTKFRAAASAQRQMKGILS